MAMRNSERGTGVLSSSRNLSTMLSRSNTSPAIVSSPESLRSVVNEESFSSSKDGYFSSGEESMTLEDFYSICDEPLQLPTNSFTSQTVDQSSIVCCTSTAGFSSSDTTLKTNLLADIGQSQRTRDRNTFGSHQHGSRAKSERIRNTRRDIMAGPSLEAYIEKTRPNSRRISDESDRTMLTRRQRSKSERSLLSRSAAENCSDEGYFLKRSDSFRRRVPILRGRRPVWSDGDTTLERLGISHYAPDEQGMSPLRKQADNAAIKRTARVPQVPRQPSMGDVQEDGIRRGNDIPKGSYRRGRSPRVTKSVDEFLQAGDKAIKEAKELETTLRSSRSWDEEVTIEARRSTCSSQQKMPRLRSSSLSRCERPLRGEGRSGIHREYEFRAHQKRRGGTDDGCRESLLPPRSGRRIGDRIKHDYYRKERSELTMETEDLTSDGSCPPASHSVEWYGPELKELAPSESDDDSSISGADSDMEEHEQDPCVIFQFDPSHEGCVSRYQPDVEETTWIQIKRVDGTVVEGYITKMPALDFEVDFELDQAQNSDEKRLSSMRLSRSKSVRGLLAGTGNFFRRQKSIRMKPDYSFHDGDNRLDEFNGELATMMESPSDSRLVEHGEI